SRTIDLGLLKDCSADWQREVTVKGAGAYSSSLRLSEHVESDYLQGQAIAASVAGGYVLRIRARSSLPYSSSFQTKLSWPVLEPAGLPPLLLTINAVVGDDLRFEPATISFGEEDFSPGGVARAVASCGIIPAPASGASAEVEQPHRSRILAGIAMLREERLRNNVDWQTLFSALTIEQPEGVAVKKIRYEYGVALQIEVRQEALNSSSVAQVIARRDQQILGQINLVLRTGQTPP
ncbi:MAG: hypothetical protein GX617_15890, partial [Lentisphaerae bacterium]|nr:hypothetical protein [Lentisphaerota bacterium]